MTFPTRLLAILALSMVCASANAQQTQPSATGAQPVRPTPTTLTERFSYGLGVSMGQDVKQQKLPLDPQWLAAGLTDALTNQALLLDEQQIEQAFQEIRGQVLAQRGQEAQNNQQQSQKFLEHNAKNPAVQSLPNGLQYQVLNEATGPKPSGSDTVRVNYTGTLVDGTVFDSSDKHGGPAEFRVGQVISGWTQALQLMPVGSKWRLFIPAELAYGAQGAGAAIGPNQALIFEVELLGILPAATQPADADAAQ
jgi:FKBP-type peptidyl-prolyl cis-trans isomerase FklB